MRFPTRLLAAGLRANPANQDPNRPTDHHDQTSGARHPTRGWWAPTAVGATAIAMAVLATAAPALAAGDPTSAAAPTTGHVYWANVDLNGLPGTIGRANLNGTMVNQSFIPGATQPSGSIDVTVDATHIYWADDRAGTIGRANLDGTGVDTNFITGLDTKTVLPITGNITPAGVAVDAAHIYWTNGQTIGRANLDGTTVDPTFITGAGAPGDVDVDAGHVYWSNQDTLTPTGQVSGIGRAGLDGSRVDPTFITVPSTSLAQGVAVDHTATP
jgi:hypothetical protein